MGELRCTERERQEGGGGNHTRETQHGGQNRQWNMPQCTAGNMKEANNTGAQENNLMQIIWHEVISKEVRVLKPY